MKRAWFWLLSGLLALLVFAWFAFPGGWLAWSGCCGWGGYTGMGMMSGWDGRWAGMGPGRMGTVVWGPFMFLVGLAPLLFLGLVIAGGVWLGLTLFRQMSKAPAAQDPAASSLMCPQCGQPVAPAWRVCPYCGTQLQASAATASTANDAA